MAIYHLSMKPVSRGQGRSAVAASAYRAGEKLTNQRDGITHDYRHRKGVAHAEIVLPDGVSAAWAWDRSALWNAAELAEKRKDARVAREFEVALPHELSAEQRLEATRAIARELANRYGAAVDFAIHAPHEASDVRNHHAHILMTTRQVSEQGLGEKTALERENRWLVANGLPTTDSQLRDLRERWEAIANRHLALAGLDIRIDHRSHRERGLEIAPTVHVGVHATEMRRQGRAVERTPLDAKAARRNAALIRAQPEQVLTLITAEKSVFDRRDVARALHRAINDDPVEFQNAFATVMASPALVELQAERVDPVTGAVAPARYSTREMVAIEARLIAQAQHMHEARSHGVDRRFVAAAMERQDAAIRTSAGGPSMGLIGLSGEQRRAIAHVTGPEQIRVVVGYAGAGKSTMLAAAREAWVAAGYSVHGAALAGKAAEALEEASGIPSRTLASWSRSWDNDRGRLGRCDVLVIDEAGMVGSRQLARFVDEAAARGAKLVLVGDYEQLQAIGAGAPFRAITEAIGHVGLAEIRRQHVDWQREASVAFATHRTVEGLAAYRDRGHVSFAETSEEARAAIVRDYLADRDARPDGTRVAMAHRRADVRALNAAIRTALLERGLGPGERRANVADAGEPASAAGDNHAPGVFRPDGLGPGDLDQGLIVQTHDGSRAFSPGDRIVFLENNRDLGVKNGMLGTVDAVAPGKIIATLDGSGRSVAIATASYQAIDHGYATTIHKNQGATVDRAYVLASATMDRHLTYVAMTRHREDVRLYAASEGFTRAGRLVAHGAAPYGHEAGNSPSYYVTLENDRGERRTLWGVDLARAMREAAPRIGDRIGLEHRGSEPVRMADGTENYRNIWVVRDANALAYEQLARRMSRSGAKETTLDYPRDFDAKDFDTEDFAERRGIAARLGISSEIAMPGNYFGQERAGQPSAKTLVKPPNAGDHRVAQAPGSNADDTPAPLVPAITHHDRSLEAIAREQAMPAFAQRFETVETIARSVFRDPTVVVDRLRAAILMGDGTAMATMMGEEPARFGALRGRSGLLGDTRERTAARQQARALASHIRHASEAFQRRLGEERQAALWQRDRDAVTVPGLTPRSARLLEPLDTAAMDQRDQLIDAIRSTPEGRAALEEARQIAKALTHRFGSSDPRDFGGTLARHPGLAKRATQIIAVARTVDHARTAELSRDHALRRQLSRKRGIGLSR